MNLYVRLEAPFEWVRVSGQRVEAFGEVANPAEYPLAEEDSIVGVVPGEWVTVHNVTSPARTKKQFLTALPYALEDAVAEDIDQLHFVCPNWQVNAASVVYVVSQAKMQHWQELANEALLPLDQLVPDYALLPLHDAAESTLGLTSNPQSSDRQLLALHSNGSGASLDAEFVDIWLSDLPISETVAVTNRELAEQLIEAHPDRDFRLWEAGSKLAHWLEHPRSLELDLMGDKYRPSVRKIDWRNFRVPAALVAASIALFLLFDVYRYFSLHSEIDSVLEQQAAVVQSIFPEIVDVPDGTARSLMERALQNRVGEPESHTATSLLAATAQILKQQRVSLTEVSFRDGRLSITCALNDLSQVDQITRSLNARNRIRAQLESSANDDGQIFASYTLEAKT